MIITIGGLSLGLLLGFALQRGGFCMNTAFRSLVFEKDRSLVRAWVVVLIINVLGVQFLTELGVLYPAVAPFFWPAMILGGLMFGAGMVLAGGCASGTYYRCGRGMLGSAGALAGFVIGTAVMDGGALAGVQRVLRAPTIDVQGQEATVFNLLGIESGFVRWSILVVVATTAVVWLIRSPKQRFLIGWSWRRTGLVVGVLALAAWLLSAMAGRDFGLSFTQPTVGLTRFLVTGDRSGMSVASFMVLGVPVGAFLAAWAAGEAVWRLPEPGRFVRQSTGGVIMGTGASLAGGCNIGHGITGISTLGIGAIVGTISIMFGCWTVTWMIMAGANRTQKTVQIAST